MLGWSSSHICFQLQSGRRAECMDEASEWVSSMRACISGCIVCKCMLCMYCMCRETMLACEEHHWTRVYVWVMLLLNARHAIVSPCVCVRATYYKQDYKRWPCEQCHTRRESITMRTRVWTTYMHMQWMLQVCTDSGVWCVVAAVAANAKLLTVNIPFGLSDAIARRTHTHREGWWLRSIVSERCTNWAVKRTQFDGVAWMDFCCCCCCLVICKLNIWVDAGTPLGILDNGWRIAKQNTSQLIWANRALYCATSLPRLIVTV